MEAVTMPPVLLWGIIILAFIIFVLIILLILPPSKPAVKRIRKKKEPPPPHETVADLQKKLVESMEATAHQNWLIIILTIIFISVSVVGGAVVMNYLKEIRNLFVEMWPYAYEIVIKPIQELMGEQLRQIGF